MLATQCRTSLLRLSSLHHASTSTCFSLLTGRTYATEVTTRGTKSPSISATLSQVEALYKTYKPITPGIRHLKRPINNHLFAGRPVRDLTIALRKKGGRNSSGKITVRHRGGGHKRRIRTVDFTRRTPGIQDVVRIEYDPGRSAHIALIKSRDTSLEQPWSYILAPEGVRAGDTVESFYDGIPDNYVEGYVDSRRKLREGEERPDASSSNSLSLGLLRAKIIKPGNVLPLRLIPIATVVHNISLKPGGRGQLVRSAGTSATVVAHEEWGRYSHVRMQSGEVRKILQDCVATVGRVSNSLHKGRQLGKAGRARWLGRRPTVRGMAMNANDHPHGGGRGKSKGNKHPVSIWGWQTKGKRTRKPGPKGPKNSNKLVVRERPRGKEARKNK